MSVLPGRWQRLRDSLAAAGVEAPQVDRNHESYSITLRHGDSLICVSDKWWNKNMDVWTGWQVTVENRDGIVTSWSPTTKKRGQVVAAVQEAVR